MLYTYLTLHWLYIFVCVCLHGCTSTGYRLQACLQVDGSVHVYILV